MTFIWDWSPWAALRPMELEASPSARTSWVSMLLFLLAATLAVRKGSRLWPGTANAQCPTCRSDLTEYPSLSLHGVVPQAAKGSWGPMDRAKDLVCVALCPVLVSPLPRSLLWHYLASLQIGATVLLLVDCYHWWRLRHIPGGHTCTPANTRSAAEPVSQMAYRWAYRHIERPSVCDSPFIGV